MNIRKKLNRHGLFISMLCIFCTYSLEAQIPTSGLIGKYNFNGNAADFSGSVMNGTVIGATPAYDRCGNQDSALYFNGSSYVELPSSLFMWLNSYSYSYWMKADVIPPIYPGLFTFSAGEGSGQGICQCMGLQPPTSLFAGSYNMGQSPVQSYAQSGPNAINNWIHVVVTRDNTDIRLYINGVQVGNPITAPTNNQNASYGSNFPMRVIIGARSNMAQGTFFIGTLDDYRIYNRPVNQQEVLALYNEGVGTSNSFVGSTICSGQTGTVTSNQMNTNWYSSPTSTTPIGTGVSYTTILSTGPSPSTFSFYASSGTCSNNINGRALVTVTVNPAPALSVPITNTFICNGQSALISASGTGNFSISTNGGPASGFTPPAILSPSVSTAYSVQVGNQYGCRAGSLTMVYVGYGPQLNVLSVIPTVCVGKSTTLTVSGGLTYTWSAPASPWFSNAANVQVSPTVTTIYTVSATSGNGCVSTSVLAQPVSPTPNIMITTNNSLICTGQNATLTASGAGIYIWNPQPLMYLNPFTVVVSPSVTSSWSVTGISNEGCAASSVISQHVDRCTGLNNLEWTSALIVYPNPNNGTFRLSIPAAGRPATVQITDISGKVIRETVTAPEQTELLFQEHLSSGVYLLVFNSEMQRSVKKIVVKD